MDHRFFYNSSDRAMGALEPGFISFTPIPMSSTGAGANFNWLPFTLISFTEWDLPCVISGFAVWLVLVFEFELLTEFVLGLVAEFELELQFTVPLERELELEFASCVWLVAVDCITGLGMDDLERGFGFGFIEFTIGIGVADWSSVSRAVSSAESGEIGILVDTTDFEKVVSWLADCDRTVWLPSLSRSAIW